MPPRKRRGAARGTTSSPPPSVSASHASHPASRGPSSLPSPAPSSPITSSLALLTDPWTDAEETALFRALVKCKPTGLHKHFRMLNLYLGLVREGYVRDVPSLQTLERGSGKGEGDAEMRDTQDEGEGQVERHTSVKGIWRKLNDLYDLEALDERELEGDYERVFGGESEEEEDEEEEPAPTRRGQRGREEDEEEEEEAPVGREFALPDDDEEGFAQLKWMKRFPSPSPSAGSGPPSPTTTSRKGRGRPKVERRDSSPAVMPELLGSRLEAPVRFQPSFSVPSDGEEEGGTPVGTTEKGAKRGRGRPTKASTQAKGRESNVTRRSSRVATNTNESEEEAEEEEGSGEEEEGEEDDEEESSSSEEEQDSPQKKPRGRGAARGRGRGAGRGRRGKK
ncbi:putative chromatin modification-related protein EAF7 [Elsinoe fawcettii]|nr:putative chromatin modification-related protein EAF7 [Elsinoe fawcettii]